VPIEPEHPLARGEQYNCYQKLLKAGVEVREYLPSDLHPKVLVADGARVLAGSANLDGASLHRNLEQDVFIEDPRAAAAFTRELFQKDLPDTRRVTMADAKAHDSSLLEKIRNRGADIATDLLSRF
jgi:cardiolipin synthase